MVRGLAGLESDKEDRSCGAGVLPRPSVFDHIKASKRIPQGAGEVVLQSACCACVRLCIHILSTNVSGYVSEIPLLGGRDRQSSLAR